MPYRIEWEKHGAIKYFSGEVLGPDLLDSEREIANHRDFTILRYVISDYLWARRMTASFEDRLHLRALRIGAHSSNPHMRFAFATTDPQIRTNLESSVATGQMLNPLRTFDTFPAARA